MAESLALKWKRPSTVEYPKVWHTFKARDLNSDELVEYRIQDLPLNRLDEIFDFMFNNYIIDEPIGSVLGSAKDPVHYEDYKMAWRPFIDQKLPIVCFKAGEIVAVNMLFVLHKDDNYMEKVYKQFKSKVTKDIFDLMFILYQDFDTFKYYGVDQFLTSFGLSVNRKYRGRGIGDQMLATRKNICKVFGLKFTHTFFSLDFSNHNADKAGFKTNVAIKYQDVVKSNPKFSHIADIKSTEMTIKTMMC